MGLGQQHDAGVALGLVERDDAGRRAQRELAAEGRELGVGADGADVAAHQAADREVADPADVVGAADRLAAQVEAPGREGEAEQAPGGQRGDDDRTRSGPGASAKSPVVSSARNTIVSGPPTTVTAMLPMPMIA